MSTLTPAAKSKLASIIRSFRATKDDPNGGILLRGLREAAESTYLLSIASIERAELPEARQKKRQRLEQWLTEQVTADLEGKKVKDKPMAAAQSKARHLTAAIKLAGATMLNRLVVIMQLEAQGMIRPAVVTGGWDSPGYREFRDEFGPDLCKDESEGYGLLLKLLYDELALELPGVFGSANAMTGITELFPVPVSTLRRVVEALNDPALASAWTDDTTLGWVYQYWNDPEREALDDKLNGGGKVEPHEIASKTQMFTERYMVEWLLQNSLGQQWLAICARNGWEPEAVADGTLARLETRRKDWREKRESGEVALDALMPTETEAEERWKYWVQQPELTGEGIPQSIRELKIFDPACGSGHFLVIAFDLLFAFYAEEARHRKEDNEEAWSDRTIVESILENNLFGLDLDPRAVQIAAAGLYIKAKGVCQEASPRTLNLVASNLNLAAFAVDDPAREELRVAVQRDTGIPGALTDEIVEALKGADAWGSLLQVDRAVDEAITRYERSAEKVVQVSLLGDAAEVTGQSLALEKKETKKTVLLSKLESFLTRRTRSDDLGLRLRGEQLAAGVRFIRMVREGAYELVVGNPPYQGTSKLKDSNYVKRYYEKAKADLYAAFLERGIQLAKPGGMSALLTMRNWMFISQYSKVREYLVETYDLRLIGDIDRGGFEEIADEVVSTVMSIFCRNEPSEEQNSIAIQPTPLDDNSRDSGRTSRKRAALLAQVGRFEFKTTRFDVIKEKPLIYWWDEAFLDRYAKTPKISEESPVRAGMQTSNNLRYLRSPWEISLFKADLRREVDPSGEPLHKKWVPYIKGAVGKVWIEPLDTFVLWEKSALEKQIMYDHFGSKGGGNGTPSRHLYYQIGVAFVTIGSGFSARKHRYRSVFGDMGQSVFPQNSDNACCLMNTRLAKKVLTSLNPTIHFLVGDVNRLPLFPIESADEIFTQLEAAFTTHESTREPSVEFIHPGPTCWPYAQTWAQRAVDRPAGEPLPPWEPEYEDPEATDWISYAIGLALGRFPLAAGVRLRSPLGREANGLDKEGDTQESDNPRGLSVAEVPNGVLYLSAYSTDQPTGPDSLTHPACAPLHAAWATHSRALTKKSLHEWLRLSFFTGVHLPLYEQRPIYFPLTSTHKNFVAYLSIHRWNNNTLTTLLADYLTPDLRALEGELSDLEAEKTAGIIQNNTKAQSATEARQSQVQALKAELTSFIATVRQCAETGPPPAKSTDPAPQAAPYQMNLDDGVMINSAALWPLLEPQWKKPRTWWHELCTAKGRKDYDWSHLAARYFPTRVDEKCQKDPSLAVAHGCFWQYHPAKAYEWELRLQDEIAPDFTIDETDSDTLRQQFETEHSDKVKELKSKEEKRRERKYKKKEKAQLSFTDL